MVTSHSTLMDNISQWRKSPCEWGRIVSFYSIKYTVENNFYYPLVLVLLTQDLGPVQTINKPGIISSLKDIDVLFAFGPFRFGSVFKFMDLGKLCRFGGGEEPEDDISG